MSALTDIAMPTPADIAARMGRASLTTRRLEASRAVRDMGIGMTDARRKRGGAKKK